MPSLTILALVSTVTCGCPTWPHGPDPHRNDCSSRILYNGTLLTLLPHLSLLSQDFIFDKEELLALIGVTSKLLNWGALVSDPFTQHTMGVPMPRSSEVVR